jgi:hypothetical protein
MRILTSGSLKHGDLLVQARDPRHAGRADGVANLRWGRGLFGAQLRLDIDGALSEVAMAARTS